MHTTEALRALISELRTEERSAAEGAAKYIEYRRSVVRLEARIGAYLRNQDSLEAQEAMLDAFELRKNAMEALPKNIVYKDKIVEVSDCPDPKKHRKKRRRKRWWHF